MMIYRDPRLCSFPPDDPIFRLSLCTPPSEGEGPRSAENRSNAAGPEPPEPVRRCPGPSGRLLLAVCSRPTALTSPFAPRWNPWRKAR